MNEDGSLVDKEKSDKDIVIMNQETGKIEYVAINDILSADAPIAVDQMRQEAEERIAEDC